MASASIQMPLPITAIINMPEPTDKHTLRSFLGHMSYIGRHIPDLRNARAPLDALLKVETKYVWSGEHAKAFAKCKKLASNPATLAHYDHSLPKEVKCLNEFRIWNKKLKIRYSSNNFRNRKI